MVQALAAVAFLLSQGEPLHLQIPDEKAPAARSLKALWKERLRVTKGDLSLRLPGGVEVFDLEGFARRCGGTVHEVTAENANHLPIDPNDIKAIEAAGVEYGEYLAKKTPPGERTLAIRAGLKAEVAEPIPSVKIVADDPALRGFAMGDVLPWCGHANGVYRQHTLGGSDAKVLAVSTANGEAVIVRKGNVYGLDLQIDEPSEKWDNRGAFHKWVPVSNLAGPGVRAGRYWPKKPSYAEFAAEVRKFADAHPEWALEIIGRRGADRIYSLTLGDPSKPLYVYIGMPHAEDEWVPALGSLSFAELVGRSRELPEVKARLEKFSVKIYPLLHPSIYESPLAEPDRPREPDRIDLGKTENDKAYSITQLHQGGDVLVPACGTPLALGRRIAERAREDFAGRHVWWFYHHRQYGPQVWEANAPVAEMPPTWSAYWWQDGKTSCYQLYPHDVVFAAKAMYFVEQDFIGLMPERFTQANHHHALHRMLFEHSSVASLLLTDQTANWCMSIFLTDHAGQDRDPGWRPEKKPEKPKPIVLLDGYHNDEPKPHYTWEERGAGGFSQLGEDLRAMGAELSTIRASFTAEALAKASALVIVDPDTPLESKDPKYISKEEADVVEAWVERGGALVLLANDKGNCEFEHLNGLAKRFGITFHEDTARTGGPAFGPLPDHWIWKDVRKLHIVGMCTLGIRAPAESVLTWEGQALAAVARKGKGTVFALGDPWLYNEYINKEDNRTAGMNLFRGLLERPRP